MKTEKLFVSLGIWWFVIHVPHDLLKIISIMLYLSEDSVFLRDASSELRVGAAAIALKKSVSCILITNTWDNQLREGLFGLIALEISL